MIVAQLAAAILSYHPALGTLPGWLTLIALGVVGFYVVRGGGGQALDVLERANRVLTDELKRRDAKEAELARTIAELRATRSLDTIVQRVSEQFDAQQKRADDRHAMVMAEFHRHEGNANDRHEQVMAATARIAEAAVTSLEHAHDQGEH